MISDTPDLTIRELAPRLQPHADIRACVGDAFLAQAPVASFADESVDFLGALSARLLAEPTGRDTPEIVALAFWLRPAHLRQLFRENEPAQENVGRVPRGVALHIAPANVDTIFLYSFALSLLAGNLNVVRVSQQLSPVLEYLLRCLRETVQEPRWEHFAARNRFVTYAHDEATNRYLSQRADVRVLWGGDATVAAFRALSARVDVHDLVFPDRYSYCAINAAAFLAADAEARRTLAKNFHNDAYSFDQLACSSPSVVYFVGEDDACRRAAAEFWNALAAVLAARRPPVSAAVEANHLVFAYEQMADGHVVGYGALESGRPKYIHLADISQRPAMCGGGMFVEAFVPSLESLAEQVRREDQTLTHFGFADAELRALVRRLAGRGLSRLVPVGKALAFSPQWEGYDLLDELTRRIVVDGL